ncbi:MAG: flagellar hook-associated protein FlgK [Senegalia sp. (in: firmicutes)]|uniref:flagellar hook-associated protein FlgK n=1 Tax=Senegalia sp. (in: firmicutes) TaxID=1924098 RepID=UPI003F955B12
MFQGLSTAISGLYVNKKALDTVSHNISNSTNPNYVRQDVIQSDGHYQDMVGVKGSIGTGVNVANIRQIRDRFLDERYRSEAESTGYWQARTDIFSQVEEIMNEPGGSGLGEVMNELWNSFDELGKDPENLTIRGMVRERAIAFVETVNHTSNQLNSLRVNLNKDISNKVNEINNMAKDIAKLNSTITLNEASGVKANDLRDKRNALIDRLSEDINIKSVENQNGSVDVYVGGVMLVSGEDSREMQAKADKNSFFQIEWKDMNETKVEIKGGYLKGIIEGRGGFDSTDEKYTEVIPSLINRLDNFVKGIADKVNAIHEGGKTLTGDPAGKFFVGSGESGEITAGNIKLNDNLDTLNNIAASGTGERGDGTIAKAIRDIRDSNLFSDTNSDKDDGQQHNLSITPDNYYRSIIADMGVEANKANIMNKTHGTIILNIQGQKSAISGVSMDEEMTNMLKFQHSYTANSRLVNAIDEMIDNVVNRMGRVGN